MIPYEEFFQFCIVIVSIIGLVFQMINNKK